MKRRISILLVVMMLVSSLLTFTVATAETTAPTVMLFGGPGFDKTKYDGLNVNGWDNNTVFTGATQNLSTDEYFVLSVAVKDVAAVTLLNTFIDYPEDVLTPVKYNRGSWAADAAGTIYGLDLTISETWWTVGPEYTLDSPNVTAKKVAVTDGYLSVALSFDPSNPYKEYSAQSDKNILVYSMVFKYNSGKSFADLNANSFKFVDAEDADMLYGTYMQTYASSFVLMDGSNTLYTDSGDGEIFGTYPVVSSVGTAPKLNLVVDFGFPAIEEEEPAETPEPTTEPGDDEEPATTPEPTTEPGDDEEPATTPEPTTEPEDPEESEDPEVVLSSNAGLQLTNSFFLSGTKANTLTKDSDTAYTVAVSDNYAYYVVGARKANAKATVYSAIVSDLEADTVESANYEGSNWYQKIAAADLTNGNVAYVAFKVVAEDGTEAFYTLTLVNPLEDMTKIWVSGLNYAGINEGVYEYDIEALDGFGKYVIAARMKSYRGVNFEFKIGNADADFAAAQSFGKAPVINSGNSDTYAASIAASEVTVGKAIFIKVTAGDAEPKVYKFTVVDELTFE